MKYFTMEWWGNQCEPVSVFDECRAYVDSVRAILPNSVIEFVGGHSLHDSTVREITTNTSHQTARIAADGFDVRLEHQVRYELEYSGVTTLSLLSTDDDGLPGLGGLGHLGYHEFESLGSGLFEHRLLFSSGVEIAIRFHNFHFVAK